MSPGVKFLGVPRAVSFNILLLGLKRYTLWIIKRMAIYIHVCVKPALTDFNPLFESWYGLALLTAPVDKALPCIKK